MRQAAVVSLSLLVLASAAASAQEKRRDIKLRPGEPKVERQQNDWKVTFPLTADLPDRARVTIRISGYTLAYNPVQKALAWHKPRGNTHVGQIIMNSGEGEYLLRVGSLRRMCVEYFVDPGVQEKRVKLKGSIKLVRREVLPGDRTERIERLLKDCTVPDDMYRELLRILDQLED
ncbi:MAG: hypothetical protein ACYTAF_01830, partial [Planctomycetota bacterium]